jgi:hypothetical protein
MLSQECCKSNLVNVHIVPPYVQHAAFSSPPVTLSSIKDLLIYMYTVKNTLQKLANSFFPKIRLKYVEYIEENTENIFPIIHIFFSGTSYSKIKFLQCSIYVYMEMETTLPGLQYAYIALSSGNKTDLILSFANM